MCLLFDSIWVCVVPLWGVVFGCVSCGELFLGCSCLCGESLRHCEEPCKLVTSLGGVLLFDMPQ